MLAFLLDYLVIAGYIVVLTLVSMLVLRSGAGPAFSTLFANPIRADMAAFLLLVLPVILYFALTESGPRQATWGKQRMRLCVTDQHGGRLSRPRALLRSVVKFLPWQIAHTSLFHIPGWPMEATTVPTGPIIGFGLVWLLIFVWLGFLIFHPARRAPYDLAAGSWVVRSPAVNSTSTARPS
jgi:uncharacterized RDD family membrane protein YckC